MKASEAILKIIETQGGEVDSLQFTIWLGQLWKAGYLEPDYRDKEEGRVYYRLTEKAEEHLKHKGL